MENSNPVLQQVSYSQDKKMEYSGPLFQVPDSSCSLSLSSEIPDIRNWFSSYEYESPVLDSNDIFRDSVSKESEIGKKELIIEEKKELIIEEKNGQKGENTGGLREIMKSDDGLVGENFCTTAFVKCSSSSGNDKQESQPLDKPADSSNSPSLFSELPDIRLWFSSYVYESPVLGSSNDFGDSLGKESQCENVGFVIEGSNTEKEDILGESYKSRNNGELIGDEMLHSDVALRCICSGNKEHKLPSSREGGDGVGWNENSSAPNDSSFGRFFEQSSTAKVLQNAGLSSTKDVSGLNAEGSQGKLEQPKGTTFMPFDISRTAGSDDRRSSNKTCWRDSAQERLEVKVQTEAARVSTESNSKLNLVNAVAVAKSTHDRSSGKENEDISEKGFVTTRNMSFTRTTSEKSSRGSEVINKRRVLPAGVKDGVRKTKVLAETTNFQHSNAMEVTGKWRCPQKSKPNIGPPLKQLRLEQWVRHT